MSISMRKLSGGKNRLPHIMAFVVAVVLALVVVGFLPLEFEIKKILFFVLIIVFAFIGVLVLNRKGSGRR